MDHAKSLGKIKAYAATLTGGTPDDPVMAAVHINIRFLRWAIAQGFEHQKSAYNNIVVIPHGNAIVMAAVSPWVGKYPAGTYIMAREPIMDELRGHRIDAEEEEFGVAFPWKGTTRNMIPVNETEFIVWVNQRKIRIMAQMRDGSGAFVLTEPNADVEFRMRFGIG